MSYILGWGLVFTYFLTSLKANLTRLKTTGAFTIAVVTLFTAVHGLADEIYQTLTPGRFFDLSDTLADVIGGITGCLLFGFFNRNNNRLPRQTK